MTTRTIHRTVAASATVGAMPTNAELTLEVKRLRREAENNRLDAKRVERRLQKALDVAKAKLRDGGATPCQPIGLPEMADLFEAAPRTPHIWRYRGILPPADYHVNGGEAWDRRTLLVWAGSDRRRGTVPPSLRAEVEALLNLEAGDLTPKRREPKKRPVRPAAVKKAVKKAPVKKSRRPAVA